MYLFGGTYTKIGTIQRRLAWPLRKDDTQNREAFHIFRLFSYYYLLATPQPTTTTTTITFLSHAFQASIQSTRLNSLCLRGWVRGPRLMHPSGTQSSTSTWLITSKMALLRVDGRKMEEEVDCYCVGELRSWM